MHIALAEVAVGMAEVGLSNYEIAKAIGYRLVRLGAFSSSNVRGIAAAISVLPQPVDQNSERREIRRQLEEPLGIPGPEQRLAAALRAREALTDLASTLEKKQSAS